MAISLFDVNTYRAANPDLAAGGLTTDAQLSQHYQSFGVNEGRLGSLFANLNVYRSSNPDLVSAGLRSNQQLLNHLQNFGVAEGRRFSQYVDINFYLSVNGDVAQAYGGNREQALEHLRSFGVNEGRAFSPFVGVAYAAPARSLDYYLAANSDVNQAVGGNRLKALEHLEVYGIKEPRSFSPFVNVGYYLSNNADLNQAFSGNRARAFEHLASFGVDEGRSFSPAFNASAYSSVNADLAGAGINTNRKRFEHWVTYGVNEGRTAIADPGNTLATALNLGSPEPGGTYFHNFISSSTDANDYYSFTLTSTRDVFVELSGLSANADILLNDSNGSILIRSAAGRNASEGIRFYGLGAGNYSVRVVNGGFNVSTSYDLDLSFLNPVDPGSTRSTASILNVGSNARRMIQGTIGGSDPADYYKFDLFSSTTFSATLFSTSFDIDLYLYNAAGTLLVSSLASGTQIDSFSRSLSPGTYYLEAQSSSSGPSTNYNLTLNFAG